MSLEALERSDLARLPGGIFTRAFIRAYAQEVGLDPDRTIQDFIAELPADAATATSRPAAVDGGERTDPDRSRTSTAFRLLFVGVPIVGLAAYFGAERAGRSPLVVPAPAGVEAAQALVPPAEAAAAMPGAAAQTTGLTMQIAAKASSWVSVTADGDLTFSGVMNAGETRTVTAREQIALNVGDAGSFTYTLNGRYGQPLGAPGEVISTRITLGNLSEFTTP
jgi:cytoskeletal protein RodZ